MPSPPAWDIPPPDPAALSDTDLQKALRATGAGVVRAQADLDRRRERLRQLVVEALRRGPGEPWRKSDILRDVGPAYSRTGLDKMLRQQSTDTEGE